MNSSSIAIIDSNLNEAVTTPGLDAPYSGLALAQQWGSNDGYNLEDQRGSEWFLVGSMQWIRYNESYITGVIDYIKHGDSEQLERARLCLRHAKALSEAA